MTETLDRQSAALARNTLSQQLGRTHDGESQEDKAMRVFLDREKPTPFPELVDLAAYWRSRKDLPSPELPWQAIFVPWARTRTTAHVFAALPSDPTNPVVREAYDELARQVDEQLTLLHALGLTVDYVSDPEPYVTSCEQATDVCNNGHLSIATIACWPEAYHPVLGNDRGGTYDRFRAVHDTFGHVAIGTGFDRHGEFAAWLHHASMFFGSAQLAATTELHGENSVLAATGVPAQHKATLLPRRLSPIPFLHQPPWSF